MTFQEFKTLVAHLSMVAEHLNGQSIGIPATIATFKSRNKQVRFTKLRISANKLYVYTDAADLIHVDELDAPTMDKHFHTLSNDLNTIDFDIEEFVESIMDSLGLEADTSEIGRDPYTWTLRKDVLFIDFTEMYSVNQRDDIFSYNPETDSCNIPITTNIEFKRIELHLDLKSISLVRANHDNRDYVPPSLTRYKYVI